MVHVNGVAHEMKRDAAKILDALRIGLQLIHPQETHSLLATYRAELEEAVRLQSAIVQKSQSSSEGSAKR